MFFNDSKTSNTLVSQFQKFASEYIDNSSISSGFYCASTPIYSQSDLFVSTMPTQPRPITKRQHSPHALSESSTSSIYSTSPSTSDSLTECNHSLSRTKAKKVLPVRSEALDMHTFIKNSRKGGRPNNKAVHCSFCKNNGESEEVYTSHVLKDVSGMVTCPILQLHVCPICEATGQMAHTITYCKEFKRSKRSSVIKQVIDRICAE
jgi:hypothetical protein